MFLFFLFSFSSFSLKPIFLVSGFGNSSIYSTILNPLLYPDCPSNTSRITIKDKIFDTDFLLLHPDCVAKLFRVQINKTTNKINQLPGIFTYSTSIGDPSIFSDIFGSIITKISLLGYQNNINFFSVGYNHFLHPITSYPVYDELKDKIENIHSQTGQKSIIISFDQGTSFASIFLSNYSHSEWVRNYIDSVIFLSPTFAGLPTLSNLISQDLPPFPTNDEFKKTIIRMPGLHMLLPNYAIFENFTIESNLSNKINASQAFEFLKELRKVDDESEIIFKSEVEKYLKVPVPEPPVPSMIIYSDKTAQTAKITLTDHHSSDSEGARYACSHWSSTKCVNIDSDVFKSNRASQSIIKFIKDRNNNNKKKHPKEQTVTYTFPSGDLADDGYVNSHMVDPLEFQYGGTEGHAQFPLSNAFDGNTRTFYLSGTTTSSIIKIEITFSTTVNLEAILFDPIYFTRDKIRDYQGTPLSLDVYTAVGAETPTLNTIFKGEPVYPWRRFQLSFTDVVTCDKLTIQFTDITLESVELSLGLATEAQSKVVASGITFIQHLDVNPSSITSASGIYNCPLYVETQKIDSSRITYSTSDNGLNNNYPLSNAFDNNPKTYYISSTTVSSSSPSSVEITFDTTVTLDAFLYDLAYVDNGGSRSFHGFPKKLNVYSATGSEQYQLVTFYYGTALYYYSRIQFVFPNSVTCDKLKLEFIEVTDQSIEGTSKNVVIAGLIFLQPFEKTTYSEPKNNYTNEGYFNSHLVRLNEFVYSGPDKYGSYELSNAFDGDPDTYYMSKTPNNGTYNNIISINFTKAVTLSSLFYDISYNSIYDNLEGCPKKIIVYSSVDGQPFTLNAVFVGEPTSAWTRIQYEFKEPIKCDKLFIEFTDVSLSLMKDDEDTNLVIKNMYLTQAYYEETFQFTSAGNGYEDDTFISTKMIDSSSFAFSAPEGLTNYELSFAFDKNHDTCYISSIPNSNTFHSSVSINFTEKVVFEAILYDPYISTSVEGCPTGVIVYASIDNEPYVLKSIFYGTPLTSWTRIQFVFPQYIECDKLLLEFVDVTTQSISGSSKSLVIPNLYFIRAPEATPEPTPEETPTQTPSHTPSQTPSQTTEETPEQTPPMYDPTEIPIENVCQVGSHCSFEGSLENPVLVTINKTDFSNIENDDSGGAIRLQNAGLICSNLSFTKCQSKFGGGGAISINNNITGARNIISLTRVSLSNCKADYGGAIHIYAVSLDERVEINNCYFSSNQASSSSSSSSFELVGGSAIFITSRSCSISECTFHRNAGESQLKIYNDFPNKRKASFLLDQSNSNIIKHCRFEIDKLSKSSLYYVAGRNGAHCYVRNSIFVGILNGANYHIDGISISSLSPKLVVEFCKFSSDFSHSFNPDRSKQFMTVVFQKQVFGYDESKESDKKEVFEYGMIFVAVILIVVIIIVFEKQSESANLETIL